MAAQIAGVKNIKLESLLVVNREEDEPTESIDGLFAALLNLTNGPKPHSDTTAEAEC